jgi:hypothetical protein
MDMELSRELAKDFNKDALTQIADHAALIARLMLDDTSFIKMSDVERNDLDTFQQFAFYARRIINMISE